MSNVSWVTIATLFVVTIGQSFAFWRYMGAEFKKRDQEMADAIRERNTLVTAIRAEAGAARVQAQMDVSRVDKDIAALKTEFSVQLARIPTRDAMEQMLTSRVGPMEADLRALVIELARLGVHNPRGRDG